MKMNGWMNICVSRYLGFSRDGRHFAYFLGTEGVDNRAFAYIGITYDVVEMTMMRMRMMNNNRQIGRWRKHECCNSLKELPTMK